MNSTNKKIFLMILSIFSALTIVTIVNVALNFRTFSKNIAISKAESIAESVRDGLTAHMVNGTMDKRDLFLENMLKHQDVKNLHLFRSAKVIELFGEGSKTEHIYSQLEDKVTKNAKSSFTLNETSNSATITVAIPYIATKYSNPNCLTCHTNAKEGDVLGVISMDVDIQPIRSDGIDIIIRVIIISVIFIILVLIIARRVIKPYIKLFNDLEEGISRAYRGDFSHHIQTNLSDEAGEVAQRLNELSEIFRFKKTIELDDSKDVIYKRLAHILTDNFKISNFVIMEINSKEQTRNVIYSSVDKEQLPKNVFGKDSNDCRAFRTNSNVFSTEFYKICPTCFKNGCEFLCIPFSVSGEYSFVLHIRAKSIQEIDRIKYLEPVIRNYFEIAQPVLESKHLMDILQDKSLKDGLTGLYNRRYLENLITNIEKDYIVLMIDVDFFKKVNDTYGHDIGDKVIVGLSNFLQKQIKGSDVAIRYGGEEFIVILYDISLEDAVKKANNIRELFSNIYFDTATESIRKTLSIGISKFINHEKAPLQAIKEADIALYKAKNSGRNKVVVFEQGMEVEK